MKKFLLALVALIGITAIADVPNPDFGHLFNRLPGQPLARKYNLGTKIREAHNTAICVYDYATQGGALGVINLLSTDLVTPCLLPGKSIIRNGMVDVSTMVLSGGSPTLSLSSGLNNQDLFTSGAKANFVTGKYAISPVFGTVSTYIKYTNANTITNGVSVNAYQPRMNVSTATLTQGHFRVYLDYVLGE